MKSVFLSFASEDGAWKDSFAKRSWFTNVLGNVNIEDYQIGGDLPFGNLKQWLEEEVNEAAVFVAIVSRHYIAKTYTLREWWLGLSAAARRKLVFVPVMIDAQAKAWWSEWKQTGELYELGDDYAYADYTDGKGHPCNIIVEEGGSLSYAVGDDARLPEEWATDQIRPLQTR